MKEKTMTLSGRSKVSGVRQSGSTELQDALKDALGGNLAICEPWFGNGSLIISRQVPAFKVRVINDQVRRLVNLFEMVRIDVNGLYALITSDPASRNTRAMAFLEGKSPFLESMAGIDHGIEGFFASITNLGITPARALETRTSFLDTLHDLHDVLEVVLVENMTVDEFIPRFDKSYSVFFISLRDASLIMDQDSSLECLASLKGHFVVQGTISGKEAFKTWFVKKSRGHLMLDLEIPGSNDGIYLAFKSRA